MPFADATATTTTATSFASNFPVVEAQVEVSAGGGLEPDHQGNQEVVGGGEEGVRFLGAFGLQLACAASSHEAPCLIDQGPMF
jgi:hypothetical protein